MSDLLDKNPGNSSEERQDRPLFESDNIPGNSYGGMLRPRIDDSASGSGDTDGSSKNTKTPAELKSAEEDAGTRTKTGELSRKETDAVADNDRVGRGFRNEGKMRSSGSSKRRNRNLILAGGGGAAFAAIAVLLVFLSSLKVVHFSEVLSAAGHVRLHGIIQERATQNMFDSALVEGDASVDVIGKSLFDRLRGINPDKDLATLGREGKFKFVFGEEEKGFIRRTPGEFKGVKINGDLVSLDSISKDLGWGENFKSLSPRRKMTVRAEFTNTLKSGVNETFALEPRYVRSRAFKYVSDEVGFKFNRFRQAGRSFFGKTAEAANVENLTSSVEQVSGGEQAPKSGIGSLDKTTKEAKERAKIQEFLEKSGKADTFKDGLPYGEFLQEKFTQNLGKAEKLRTASETVAAGTLVMTIACMTNLAITHADELNRSNERAMARDGMQLPAFRSQLIAKDVPPEANAAVAHQYDGDYNYSGAEYSPAYQRYIGNEDPPIPNGLSPPKISSGFSGSYIELVQTITKPSFLTTFGAVEVVNKIPVIGGIVGSATDAVDQKFCEFLLSPAGVITATLAEVILQTAIGIFSGSAGTIGSEAGLKAVATGMVKAVGSALKSTVTGFIKRESLAALGGVSLYAIGLEILLSHYNNSQCSGAEMGANKFECDAAGTEVVEQMSMRTSVKGRPLNKQEVAILDEVNKQDLRNKYNQRGVFEKYFAINNPFSITGALAARSPSTVASATIDIRRFASSIGSIFTPQRLLQPILAGTMGKASAATTDYDPYFNVAQWGYSVDEIQKMRDDPSYTLEENEKIIGARIPELEKKYGPCYLAKTQYDANKLTKDNPNCSASALSSEEALRYRIYTGLDAYVVDDLTGGLTVSSTNSTSPTNTTPGTIIAGDTSSMQCPSGTVDAGIGDGYKDGQLFKIRLCDVQGITVNAQIAASLNSLLNASKSKGITLGGSGFRSMADQQRLYDCYLTKSCNGGALTAAPGFSNHQMGLAVDFSYNGTTLCFPNTSSQCIGNTAFDWLQLNAGGYGLLNLPTEAWHWSYNGK